ncbi:hypothetical protein OC844_005883 [Tilletia horrida]|nr:hypothetical protein OC844_005883 [Tilletia horrida]
MQSFKDVDMDTNGGAPPATAAARMLTSALGGANAAGKKRVSPYDRRAQDPKERWQHDKYAEHTSGLGARLSSSASARDLRGAPPTSASYMSPKLKITNLHYEITETDLRGLFASIGALAGSPEIIYDRSGRSTGVAIVLYKNVEDAARAKNEFDGQHARGEPISVSYEPHDQRKARRSDGPDGFRGGSSSSSGGGGGASRDWRTGGPDAEDTEGAGANRDIPLLQRVEGRKLLSRLDAATSAPKQNQRRGPTNQPSSSPGGPRSFSSRSARGPGNSRGAGGYGGGAKTAIDLDAELDAFMKAPVAGATGQKAAADGDVDMQ